MPAAMKEWHWEVTTKCNLNCLHCLTACGAPRQDELSAEQSIRAVRVMKSLGCKRIMFTGGEPFCCCHLPDILRECRNKKIKTSLLTNGSLIDSQWVRQSADLLEMIGVSIDGSRAEINDPIRGKGTFERACRAVRFFSEKIITSVFITVSKPNIHDLENAVQLFWSLGADIVHVSSISISGRAQANKALLGLSSEEKLWLEIFAQKSTGYPAPDKHCSTGEHTLYVSSSGLVYPCSEIAIQRPQMNFGSIIAPGFRRKLSQKRRIMVSSTHLECCYRVYAGDRMAFYLESNNNCPFICRKGVKNDQDA